MAKTDPDLPDLSDFMCFAVYAANQAFGRAYKPLLEELGLTYPQYLVLVTLWAEDGQTVGSIGQKLSLESNTLTPLLKRLEAQGLVTRSRSRADERQVVIRLTEEGQALREKARLVPQRLTEIMGYQGEEAAQLRGALAGLRSRLTGREPE